MDEQKALAYLDHKVLDLMTKGDPLGVIPLLEKTKLIPVYSDENLREIQKPKGYEQSFLDILEAIGALNMVLSVLPNPDLLTGFIRFLRTLYESNRATTTLGSMRPHPLSV